MRQLLLAVGYAASFAPRALQPRAAARPRIRARSLHSTPEPEVESAPTDEPAPVVEVPPVSATPAKYDVSRLVSSDGPGFNQFDPVLTATRGLSRRFGLAGGLAIFGILLAVEGDEIVKALGSAEPVAGTGEVVKLQQGLSYTESLVGRAGDAVSQPGAVVGLGVKVSVAFPDSAKVIFDSDEDGKPIAFKYGQRPFQNVLCEGVELGIKGMKAGGRRRLVVPAALAPKGVDVPPGAALVYDVEVKEVLPGYF